MQRKFTVPLALTLTVILIIALTASVIADTIGVDFETYSLGNVNGQDGWSMTGPFDVAVVTNSYGYGTFGTKSLRISNATTSGSFGDQTFAKPLTDAVGETAATAGAFSEGTRQTHFEMQFDIASTLPGQQAGMVISVSPDRGDGSRMSYLRFEDAPAGINVFFDDVQQPTPCTPSGCANFVETQVGTDLSRATAHTIKLTMDALDGPSNDVVKVFIDGILVHTGTSWEDYYRYDPEAAPESTPRIVKTVLFRAAGAAVPANLNNGFLIDNLALSSTAGVVTNLNTSETFNTIQAAIDDPDTLNGHTINIGPGTYVEQVEVNKELTIQGAGASTVIEAFPSMPLFFTTSANNYPVVYVHDVSSATIKDLVVDGAGNGNTNNKFSGIAFRNAGGTVDSVEVTGIRDTPFSGAQHGVAIYAYNDDTVARSITVKDSDINDFQKNAMALNADANTALTVNVTGNTVTGAGTTAITAQNGIQVYADLATGTVTNNTVSDIGYDNTSNPTKYVATSILDFYADIDITGNTVTGAQVGVYFIEGSGDILNNTISVDQIGNGGMWGVIATDPPDAVPSPFGAEDMAAATGDGQDAPNSTLTVDVSGNTVTFVGGNNTSTFGIEADSGYGPDDLVVTANNNVVTGFEVGIELYECQSGCSTGVFTSVTANDNCLYNNTYGMRSNDSDITVDGEDNWWGDTTGPYNATSNSGGLGNQVSDYIDFSPWNTVGCGLTELSLSTNDSLFCTSESTTVLIDLDQVAGLYGYQLEVTYDDSLASASGAFVNSFFDTVTDANIPSGWNADCTTTPGTCKFSAVKLHPATPINGSGTLAQITLTGATPGTFNMTFGTNTLTDIDGIQISHNVAAPLPVTVCGYATISGNITMQGRPGNNVDAGTVTMTEQAPTSFSSVAPVPFSASNGAYSISVPYLPTGSSYKILAEHGLYLDNEDTILVTGSLANKNTRLWGGDANNDGKVSIADLSCIGGSFGGPVVGSCAGGSSDINADNVINVQDLAIAGGNFDKCNNQPWNWSVDPPNYPPSYVCVP